MDELLEQFLIEGRELVQAAGDDLLALERAPGDAARLDAAFRAVHTLKGGAALFPDLAPMGRALHAAEDLLGTLRGGRAAGGRDIHAALDAVLACVGACEGWLDAIAATGALPADAGAVAARLAAALRGGAAREGGAGAASAGASAPPPADAPDWLAPLLDEHRGAVARARAEGRGLTALRYRPRPDCFFFGDDPLALVRAVPGLVGLTLGLSPAEAGQAPPSDDPFTCRTVIAALAAAPPEAASAPFRFVADQVEAAAVPAEPPAATESPAGPSPALPSAGRTTGQATAQRGLRVDPAQVDALLALAGELVAATNGGGGGPAAGANCADLDRLVRSVYAAALQLRLVPLSVAFRRLPRVVRDAAARLGREVDLVVRGDAVELDKAVVDGLHEPLLHALRNAVDHGVEPPAARLAAGKPPRGRILLHARQDAESVVVEVSDDGAGIDPERLRAAAVARGLLAAPAAAALDDAAALDLVFAPGFSTAAGVTDISGRGVGMDAVRAGVAALGGRVELSSVLGRGTALRMVLPRASAVATVLTVDAGGERYGVLVEAVVEVLQVPRGRILRAGAGRAFVLRDRAVPLVELARVLDLAHSDDGPDDGAGDGPGDRLVVVAAVEGAPVGLAVDAVGRSLDVLLRPLAGLLASVPGLLGTALLGDGGVLMVLDVAELTRWG